MGFSKSTADVKVHQSMADYPRVEDGMSAEELKKKFDAPAEQLQKDLNKLVDELDAETGAINTGAMKLTNGDASDNNVQAKLLYLLEQIQNAVLSQIPDGTVTKAKMNIDYANNLAEKDGTLQTGLNAEFINGNTDIEMYRSMIKIGTYTGNSVESQTVDIGFKPSVVFVCATSKKHGTSGGYSVDNYGMITEEGFNESYTDAGVGYYCTNVLTETGFTVKKLKRSNGAFLSVQGLNVNGQKYSYIAFR